MGNFSVQDKEFAARVRASFARQGFMEYVGAYLNQIDPGYVEIHVPFNDQISQQHGFFHGGLIGTIGDTAAGYAAFSLMPQNASILTVEYKLNLMAPAEGEMLIARGRVVRAGRTLTVCQCDIYVARNNSQKHCAILLGTFMTMANTPDKSIDKSVR